MRRTSRSSLGGSSDATTRNAARWYRVRMATEARLGPYLLRNLLGRGGMGEVWDAVHGPSGARVAVKVLTTRGERLEEGLRTELRAVAALDHPNVVAPLDAG